MHDPDTNPLSVTILIFFRQSMMICQYDNQTVYDDDSNIAASASQAANKLKQYA